MLRVGRCITSAVTGTGRFRSAIGALVHRINSIEFVEDCWPHLSDVFDRETSALDDLRRLWNQFVGRGRKWKDATSPVYVLRPWRTVSEPIRASNDEAAIATLLIDARCRPPAP
jgi:hypothetical protein